MQTMSTMFIIVFQMDSQQPCRLVPRITEVLTLMNTQGVLHLKYYAVINKIKVKRFLNSESKELQIRVWIHMATIEDALAPWKVEYCKCEPSTMR